MHGMRATPTDDYCWTVLVQGELDISTRRHLAEVAEILAGLGKPVEFDLSGVTFIDPSGWGGVTQAIDALERAGVAARVVHPSEPVKRLRSLLAHPALPRAA